MSRRNRWIAPFIALVIALFYIQAFNAYAEDNNASKAISVAKNPATTKSSTAVSGFDPDSPKTIEAREKFRTAERAISKGQLTKARKIMVELGDYALVPYLELGIMQRDLYRVPSKEVEHFIEKHKNTWAGEKARLNWLTVLSARRKYKDYIRHYQQVEPTTVTQCQYLRALTKTDKSEEAYKQVPDIWLSGTSLPDACDPIFSSWKKSKKFDEEYIWQRFLLARKARQYGLARYLTTLAKTPNIKERIKMYYSVRNNPKLVTNTNNFKLDEPGSSQLIEYGLWRLSTQDAAKTYVAFKKYMELGVLDLVAQQKVIESLMKAWTGKDAVDKAFFIAKEHTESIREQQLDWQLQQSLKKQNWKAVIAWSDFLDEESKSTDKWQYWIARSKSQLGESASPIFAALSNKRSYYGHLASLLTEQPFHLEDTFTLSDSESVEKIKTSIGSLQALELDRIGYYLNSRNAWNVTLKPLSEEETMTAGQAAHELGLHYSGIVSMAKTGSWQNLTVRFPLAYQNLFEKAATQQDISQAWVTAVSRQESSFAPDIRSSAGARGLMQVLPSTAKEMARKIGVGYDRSRLREPEYNIPLGAAYLKQGMKELSGNMIYATAGYNAGIHRAKTWLKDGKDKLPLDIWTEIIPYKETRQYVKNVMDYSVIYADKLSIEAPLETMSSHLFIGTN